MKSPTDDTPPANWAVVAAYAVPLCVLPSAIWRLSVAPDEESSWYLVLLSVLSLGLALLTLGLVQRWGERIPSWVPRLGGRPIPPRPVVVTAVTGGAVLVAICVYFFLNQRFGFVERGWGGSEELVREKPGWDIMRYYLPLVAWGPLVLAVAADYHRRRAGAR
jgi:hypothetical protein